jgi:type II secretory pathway component PulF
MNTPILALAIWPDGFGLAPYQVEVAIILSLVAIIIVLGLFLLLYRWFSMPLRRSERAYLFLDVIETGLAWGQSLERSIIGLAALRDRALGTKFHLLAAYIERGKKLGEALDLVPGFLPPQLVALLKVGLKLGDVPRVIPAGRRLMADATSKTQGGEGYLLVIQSFLLPVLPVALAMLTVFVVPKFVEIARDMGVQPTGLSWFILKHGNILVAMSTAVSVLALPMVFCYLAGPRSWSWSRSLTGGFVDHLLVRLPWVWKRLQRDFSTLLAILLDAGISESEAIAMAATATDNQVVIHRAQQITADLRQGRTLAQAARHLDQAGDLQWRLANAAQGRARFLDALRGWHEALDAQAYQLEQTASHLLTTALVIINGIMVGLVVTGVLGLLIAFIDEGVLW